MSERFAGRSIHGAPQYAKVFALDPVLRIDGAMISSALLTIDQLAALDRVSFLDQFRAAERTYWPETNWSGIPISALLEFVTLDPNARWVQVAGGPLASVLPLEMCHRALLCDQLNDEPLPLERGGPYRLVCPEIDYNLCVKWVDRIVVSIEEPDRSVERVAIARQRARDARSG